MNQPKVSVIIPVYNVEAYLGQCLDSVCGQTLRDIEIIPVDDGSPDGCGKIIDEYAANDPRIKPIHQQNGGYGKAVNAGLSVASGEFVAIVESDDWAEPDMLQVLYSSAKKAGCKVAKGSFRKIYKDKPEHECSIEHISGGIDGFVSPAESLELMLYESSIWSALYDREFLRENNIRMIETPGAGYQDVVWKFMVYSLCDKVFIVNKPVYNYRVFALGSSSASGNKAAAMFHNYDVIREHLNKHGIFETFKQSYFVHQIFDCVFHVNRLTKEGRKYFYKKAGEMIGDAEANGVDIAAIPFSEDINDYVSKHVIPLYNSIKEQKTHHAEAKLMVKKALRNLVDRAASVNGRLRNKAKAFRFHLVSGKDFRSINDRLEQQSAEIHQILEMSSGHATLINELLESEKSAWERNWKEFESAAQYVEMNKHAIEVWETQNAARERNWKEIEGIGQSKDVNELVNNFWESQSAAWERNWKELEGIGRSADVIELVNNFWESQSAAWERNWGEFERVVDKNKLVVSIPAGVVNQYEYYIRANEKEVAEKILGFKKSMDAESCKQVDKYFNMFRILPNNFDTMTEFSFPLFMDCFSDEERFLLCNYDLIMTRIKEIYNNLDLSEIPLSLNAHYFECGIKLLPNRLSEGFSGKIAIDCGAWVGDTAIAIARYGFKKIHCFEPIPDTYQILQRNIQKNNLGDYINCHSYAVGNILGSVKMKQVGSQAEGALLAIDGDVDVQQTTIDHFISVDDYNDVALIKIDIEGVELDALKGAEGVIKASKPVMLVSVYHTWISPDQLFEVKNYIESLNLGYKFKFKGMQPEKGLIYEYGLICYV